MAAGLGYRLGVNARYRSIGGGSTSTVTHGDELTLNDVGPWSLQGVPRDSETVTVLTVPSRGYWRMDASEEFIPSQTYIYNNDPSNLGGIVPAGGLVIDGYLVPAGTQVCQFRDLSGADFYCQNQTSGTFLFRGCRHRNRGVVGDASLYNNYGSTSGFTTLTHFCDYGGLGAQDSDVSGAFLKFIGGANHRVLRTYMTYLSTGIQPNVPGCELTENFIDKLTFYYGENGPSGTGGDPLHLNGISTEGGMTSLKILRNHIMMPSPDEAGRITTQTDCIAIFNAQGANNGSSPEAILIEGNYLGGAGYTCYASDGNGAGGMNNVWRNNKISTKWWTNGGNYGPLVAVNGFFGSNGNVSTGNIWADDYGSGGNGQTPVEQRQYPNGDGPRKGSIVF